MITLNPDDFRSLDEAEMRRLWLGAHLLSPEDIIAFGMMQKPMPYNPAIYEPVRLPVQAPSDEVLQLYQAGKRFDALKLYYKETGCPMIFLQKELMSSFYFSNDSTSYQ